MALRPIALYPDPVLLRPTEPVAEVDAEVRDLVADMIDTMYRAPGIGLAANQVGVPWRVCIVDLSVGEEPGGLNVLINPRLSDPAGREAAEEGCLSFPGITLDVERAGQIRVDALDLEGQPWSGVYDGLMARAIQHECEHLDGQTFLRNVSALKRELIKKQIRKLMRDGDWVDAAGT